MGKLEDIYKNYLKESNSFNNKLVKETNPLKCREFCDAIRYSDLLNRFNLKQEYKSISDEKEAKLIDLINERSRINKIFFDKLINYVKENPRYKDELNKYITSLEASKNDFLYQANYWFSLPRFIGVLGTLILSFLTLSLLTTILDKALIALIVAFIVFFLNASLIYPTWSLKQLVSQTESFIVIAKGVLEQESK